MSTAKYLSQKTFFNDFVSKLIKKINDKIINILIERKTAKNENLR